MNLRTVCLALAASPESVFNFVADIENLPRWAPSLCERLFLARGRWAALSPLGEVQVDLEASAGTGVVDLRFAAPGERSALLPLRVIALGPRASLLQVTFVPAPEWPEGVLQCDADTLLADLEGLVRRFGGGEVCTAAPAPQLAELGLN